MAEGGRALFFFDGAVLFGIVVGRQIHIGKAPMQRARIFAARIAGDGVFFCRCIQTFKDYSLWRVGDILHCG